MKTKRNVLSVRLFVITAIMAAIVFNTLALTACDDPSKPTTKQTPTVADYTIGNLSQTAGKITAVTIKPKDGKSSGAITIYYEGTGGTTYAKSKTTPTAAGTYTVTFDIAEAKGFNAVSGLYAGTLTIIAPNQTPVAGDYNIGNLTQTVGSVSAVTIVPKTGKSIGAITIFYNGSTTLPTAAGIYTVTFSVAAVSGFNAATGLSAGTLTINATNQTPVATDYEIGNLTQTAGSVTAVTITPKTGKSSGARTIYYNGSTTLPTTAGTYIVTFDVAAASGFNATTGLNAGTLTISNATPTIADYEFGNLTQIAGNVTAVTVTPKIGKSSGARTIYYEGTGGTTYTKSTTLPTAVGTYAVIFDVAAVTNWNAITGLRGENLVIGSPDNQTPAAGDYEISGTGTFTYDGSARTVTVKAKSGKSTGAVTVEYNNSTTVPTAAGTYTVTFDVAAVSGWNAASGLSAGTLIINTATPVASDYEIGNLTQNVGSITTVTITPKPGKSSGARTIYYQGTGNTTYAKSTTLPTASGKYTVTFDVAATTNFNAVNGFSAGTLTIVFTSIADFGTWLYNQPDNAAYTAYTVLLNVSDLGGGLRLTTKYVNLDLSGSTFTSIGDRAFKDCTRLTSVTIPDSVTSIGRDAFDNCTRLTSVTIPDSVTHIGEGAFNYCIDLTSITIPDSVTSIGDRAFSQCRDLTSVTIGNGVTSIGYEVFGYCTSLTSINIPNSVTSIGQWAFSGCSSLTSVTIPDSVTSIGREAFSGSGLTSITIPSSVTSTSGTFINCYSLANVIISNGVTSIGVHDFYGCSSLTSITIPDSVTSIGGNAFYGCSSLTSVTIPNGVTSIERNAFYGCSSLTSVTIPNGVTSIGERAFYHSGLTSIIIPNSVTSIEGYAFYGCSSLTSVTFQGTISSNFASSSFEGDLCTKFYATNSTYGTPGTYTRPRGSSDTWTKQ